MSNPVIQNKKARRDYEIIEDFTAGMVLQGSEIKSIRMGKASIKEAYCYIKDGELWIRNMHISPYEEASYENHEPLRERKLLLNNQELKKIERKMRDVGMTIVPLKVFIFVYSGTLRTLELYCNLTICVERNNFCFILIFFRTFYGLWT